MELTTIYTIVIVAEICRFVYNQLRNYMQIRAAIRRSEATTELCRAVSINMLSTMMTNEFKPLDDSIKELTSTAINRDITPYAWVAVNLAYQYIIEKYLHNRTKTPETPVDVKYRYRDFNINPVNSPTWVTRPGGVGRGRPFQERYPFYANYANAGKPTQEDIDGINEAIRKFREVAETEAEDNGCEEYCTCDQQISEESDSESVEINEPPTPPTRPATSPPTDEVPEIIEVDDLPTTRQPRFHPLQTNA